MARLKKIILITSIAFLSILCAFSLAIGIYYTSLSHIHKISITRGAFDIIGKTAEFDLTGMKNGTEYDVIMRFYYPRPIDDKFRNFKGRTIEGSNYTAEIEAVEDNRIIKKETLLPDSHKTKTWGADYFELYLIDITGKRKQPASVRATFFSEDALFNKLEKELYIEEQYDHAALPYWLLIVLFSFAVSLFSFILLSIIGIVIWRKKRQLRSPRAME